jgi:hypothetical protein
MKHQLKRYRRKHLALWRVAAHESLLSEMTERILSEKA